MSGWLFNFAMSETHSNTDERRWMDVKTAAAHLGASVCFVRNLIWGGEIPFVRAGKRFVVDRADLDSWAVRKKERNPA